MEIRIVARGYIEKESFFLRNEYLTNESHLITEAYVWSNNWADCQRT